MAHHAITVRGTLHSTLTIIYITLYSLLLQCLQCSNAAGAAQSRAEAGFNDSLSALSHLPERTVDFLLDCTRERTEWLYRRPCLPLTGNGEC
jgi:hypothetical protein